MRAQQILPSTILAAGLALSLGSTTACAQDFPNKPVRIVVPFAPGGVSDILGRVLAQPH